MSALDPEGVRGVFIFHPTHSSGQREFRPYRVLLSFRRFCPSSLKEDHEVEHFLLRGLWQRPHVLDDRLGCCHECHLLLRFIAYGTSLLYEIYNALARESSLWTASAKVSYQPTRCSCHDGDSVCQLHDLLLLWSAVVLDVSAQPSVNGEHSKRQSVSTTRGSFCSLRTAMSRSASSRRASSQVGSPATLLRWYGSSRRS